MQSKARYRSVVYTEFHPRDFDTHFYAANALAETGNGKKYLTFEEFMIDYTAKVIEESFGPGKMVNAVVLPVDITGDIFYCKADYYFDGPSFTQEQKEFIQKFTRNELPYEEVPAGEAESDAQ